MKKYNIGLYRINKTYGIHKIVPNLSYIKKKSDVDNFIEFNRKLSVIMRNQINLSAGITFDVLKKYDSKILDEKLKIMIVNDKEYLIDLVDKITNNIYNYKQDDLSHNLDIQLDIINKVFDAHNFYNNIQIYAGLRTILHVLNKDKLIESK